MTEPQPTTSPQVPGTTLTTGGSLDAPGATGEAVMRIPANHLMGTLLGPADEFLDVIEQAFAGTAVHVRGNEVSARGPEAVNVARLFEELLVVAEAGQRIDTGVVRRTIDMVRADEAPSKVLTSTVLRRNVGGNVRPKTAGQKRYVDAISNNLVTFGIGPAGTGKSWLAVATAVQALQAKVVDRIVLTRPAVEAGEKLGFLPGDMKEKIDPYLQPLYDALQDMLPAAKLKDYMENGTIQIAPLAFMRGRTLSDAVVILDEAQNSTTMQIKMFLTRMGLNTKMIVTGDITQIDLPMQQKSGLIDALEVLRNVKGIAKIEFDKGDIVRHKLVQRIVEAYEKAAPRPPKGGV